MAASTSKGSSSDFEAIRANLQKSLLQSTRLAAQLPSASDLRYQRTLSRPLGKKVDQASKRLLHITSRVLDLAKQASNSIDKGKKPARDGEASELQEEDVVDSYQGKIVKVTDYLLEQIDRDLDEAFQASKKSSQASQENPSSAPIASTSRAATAESSASRNFRSAGDIRKPQLDFGEGEYSTASNVVFKPLLSSKPHAIEPLDSTPAPYEDGASNSKRSRIPNPYAKEIQAALAKPFPELENSYASEEAVKMSSQMANKPYLYVDTVERLAECLAVLKEAKVIAIDLEHHDLRTYRGITCLMQVSTVTHDYIIDPLVPTVRSNLHTLNKAFANPDIIKVLHGADWDIIWLQRDFGLYIVNLFDTYHASRAINRLSGHSLASLLQEYTTFVPEKKYQLADWRIRPLTEDLINYARSDTHFLIYIFFAILGNPAMTPAVLQDIRARSAATASQVYEHAEYDFEEGNGPGGWRRLADRSGRLQIWGVDGPTPSTRTGAPEPWQWTDKQGRTKFEVFRCLHAWRDRVAREEDESTGYILSNKNLMAVAERLPETLADLVFCLGADMKGAVGQRSDAILEQVAEGKRRAEEVIKKQGDANGAHDVAAQAAAPSSGLWADASSTTMAAPTTSSAFAKAFSVTAQPSASSRLFPASEQSSTCQNPARSGFEKAVKSVHQALLQQFQSASTAILNSASTAEASDTVHVKAEPETSQESVKHESKPNDDGIIVINSRKKAQAKKRKSPEAEQTSEIAASTSTVGSAKPADKRDKKPAYVKPFDYTGVKSVLDEPMEEQKPRKRPKKLKGANQEDTATSEGPIFKRAPKSMNQPKSGNKSHTFV